MPIDSAFTAALSSFLDSTLKGARIDKIYMPARDETVFFVRGINYSGKLYVGVGSSPRVTLTGESFENPEKPPMVCMFLRKHLQGARILSVSQPVFDRVIKIELECRTELLDLERRSLVVELLGAGANMILLSENGTIIEAVKKTDITAKKRCIMPGVKYEGLPSQNKLDITAKGIPEDISFNLEIAADQFIMERFSGFSPFASREIAFRATGETGPILSALEKDKRDKLKEELREFLKAVAQGDFKYTMLTGSDGVPADFYCFDPLQYGGHYKKVYFDDPVALINSFYEARDSRKRKEARTGEVTKLISTLKAKGEKKLFYQQKDLEVSLNRERFRVYGELLQVNADRITKGDEVAVLENYYDDMKPCNIAISPFLSPLANSQNYFKKYQKAKNAEAALKKQIELTKEDIAYLDSVLEALKNVENADDLSEILKELGEQKYLKSAGVKKRKKTAYGFAVFLSSDGFIICAGKNNSQNDELTHRVADKDDIWMHAQNIPGSHVVIICEGNAPPERTLEEAANIASCMSKAKSSGKVPVQYTQIKNLKKPAGSRPGFVTFRKFSTIFVVPDEAAMKALRK